MEAVLLSLLITIPIFGLVIFFASRSSGGGSDDREYSYIPVDTKTNRTLDELNYRDRARYMNQMIDRMQSENKDIKNRHGRD